MGKKTVDPNTYWLRKDRHKCPKCGKKVRGPNHEEGIHHNGGVSRGTRSYR